MNFYIDKPTLRDIPAMRNLVLPEVQRGIILDRTEDEMAGAIRSYSVIRIAESSASNSPLDLHSADFANLGHCADFSLALRPKFAKNHESQTENPSVVDSANLTNSQNLGENLPIHCHSERSEESQNKNNRDSSPTAQNDNFKKIAESSLDSALSTQGANSAIADEFLGFCEASDKDKTKVYRGSEPKRALRKQLAHTCKSLKSRCESEFASPIVAFAALQILSLTLAEVRSLIVAENYRRNGLATMLIEHLIAEARALNLKEVLALTYQREVFEKLGFKEIAKESLPNQKIWADCIKCKKFPVCDEIALTKIL